MRYQLFVPVFLMLFPALSYAADNFEIKNDAEVEQAVARTQGICMYSMQARDPDKSPLRAEKRQYFNSFFVGHSKVGDVYREVLIGPGHGLICEETSIMVFGDADLALYDIDSFDAKFAAVSIWYQNAERGPGRVTQVVYNSESRDFVDIAQFTIDFPLNLSHKHLPIGLSSWFDVGSKVVMRGFMDPHELRFRMFRYKEAHVEEKGKTYVRVSTEFRPGISGSPLTINRNGKWYAIGVMVRYAFDQRYGFWDTSWATIIQENFLK